MSGPELSPKGDRKQDADFIDGWAYEGSLIAPLVLCLAPCVVVLLIGRWLS